MTLFPEALLQTVLFGIGLTVIIYSLSEFIVERLSLNNIPPLIIATLLIMAAISYIPGANFEVYNRGAQFITFLLGPATIALAMPLVENWSTVKNNAKAIIGGVTVATLTGIVSIYVCAKFLGATDQILLSIVPKSVTTPIAMEVSAAIGGIPALTVACVIFTGMLGASVNHKVLSLLGITNNIAIGLAIGASSHALGTSACIGKAPLQLAISSVSIALTGIATSILAPLLIPLLKGLF